MYLARYVFSVWWDNLISFHTVKRKCTSYSEAILVAPKICVSPSPLLALLGSELG